MGVVAIILLLGLPGPAHAYIDPSAGSLLLQLILGGVAGLLVALRLSWRRLTGLFGRQPRSTTPDERDRPR